MTTTYIGIDMICFVYVVPKCECTCDVHEFDQNFACELYQSVSDAMPRRASSTSSRRRHDVNADNISQTSAYQHFKPRLDVVDPNKDVSNASINVSNTFDRRQ